MLQLVTASEREKTVRPKGAEGVPVFSKDFDFMEPLIEQALSELEGTYGPRVYAKSVILPLRRELAWVHDVQRIVTAFVERIILNSEVCDLRAETQKLRQTVELFGMNEASMAVGGDGTILDVNEKFAELSGYSKGELVGKKTSVMNSGRHSKEFWDDLWRTVLSKKVWVGDICNKRKDGTVFWLHTIIKPVLGANGEVLYFSVVRQDITELEALRKRNEDLIHQSIHPLTGLPNRTKLIENLSVPGDRTFAVIHINRMIEINNAYWHDAGDISIIQMAVFLKEYCSRTGGLAYKLEGTDFAAVFPRHFSQEELRQFYSELEKVEAKYDGNSIPLTFSVGIVIDGERGKDIVTQGYFALHHSKDCGEYVVFDETLASSDQYRENFEMASLVRHACENDLFVPFFQEIRRNPEAPNWPVHDLIKGLKSVSARVKRLLRTSRRSKKRKFEALVRMYDSSEKTTLLPPGKFLPTAKKISQLRAITRVVIDKVFAFMVENPDAEFSINLSGDDLSSPLTVEYVREKVAEYGIDPGSVIFEILEEVGSLQTDRIMANIRELKAMGCKIAIDDFGSESSNFSRMLDFNPDYIKIDMRYVRGIDTNVRNRNLMETIVFYARKNHIEVIAEGVETLGEQRVLEELGVDFSQGYLFSIPGPSINPAA